MTQQSNIDRPELHDKQHLYRMGLDIGSTTVKVVILDGIDIVYETYRRHNSDIKGVLIDVFSEAQDFIGEQELQVSITGSGGVLVAKWLDLPFVQEVIAETEAINVFEPETDVIIELGGEDAKITYLHPVPEQRMNGSCAGGTGSFIDQMAQLLQTDAAGLNELAKNHKTVYPIASRCGVFAKSDIQPLMNDGAAPEDLAASVFQAVVTQTIAGLSQGRPIRGNVCFLGGPLHFLPELRKAFENTLKGQCDSFKTPDNAQLFVAIGAALLSRQSRVTTVSDILSRFSQAKALGEDIGHIPALFADDAEFEAFQTRHEKASVPTLDLKTAQGPMFFGLDAGSTTTKAVLTDASGDIYFTHYMSNEGSPVRSSISILKELYKDLPEDAFIARACVTGYGEALLQAALGIDEGEIETMAHYRGAEHFSPDVDFIVDIGGQDMKCMHIKNGVIDNIMLNEACSSGCGSFIQTFAHGLGMDTPSFAQAALEARNPVDLGTRCTVFMNSRVKQAQKEGASVGDISAGLSYSVVRNALYKVIKIRDPKEMGKKIVVQGGTFLNDSILRSFELISGRQVVRPNIAGLMGAFGSALIARSSWDGSSQSTVLSPEQLETFTMETTQDQCNLCGNRCKLTIASFGTGVKHVSGNRCERGAAQFETGTDAEVEELPNLYDYKYRRTFSYYKSLPVKEAKYGTLGIPRTLNIYENYPIWHTIFTQLGFRVQLSGRSSHKMYEKGIDSIPSESVCYPAKLSHGHVIDLINKQVKTIFYPSIPYEIKENENANNHFNCPIVTSYPEVIKSNVDQVKAKDVTFLSPFLPLHNPDTLVLRLWEMLQEAGFTEITKDEVQAATDAGYEAYGDYKEDLWAKGEETVRWLEENNKQGIVLAGRPYHIDPEINHGIPELINTLGMAVLTEDSVAHPGQLERPIRVVDQWMYHTRLYEAAAVVAKHPNLELVQLNSFGCGLDAVTTDQTQDILETQGELYTCLKIDEVSNLGASRIRLRSLKVAMDEREVQRKRREKLIRAKEEAEEATGTRTDSPYSEEGYAAASAMADADYTEADLQFDPEQIDDEAVAIAEEVGDPRVAAMKRFGAKVKNLTSKSEPEPYVMDRAVFTKDMKEDYTLLCPQLFPAAFELIEPVMNRYGYNVKVLKEASKEDIECGLKYVNNDACYPTIIVVGQLMNAILSGEYDVDKVALMITQTGGGCRATNYVAFIRKALKDAGLSQVPVIALSVSGIETNPGFTFTLPLIHHAVQGLVLGDLLMTLLLRVRPYETEEGAANALYDTWVKHSQDYLSGKDKKWTYNRLIDAMIEAFDTFPMRDIRRKPRVGLVGEILVKFHPDANNNALEVIEQEGCEAVMPGMVDFFLYAFHNSKFKHEVLGDSWLASKAGQLGIRYLELYRRRVKRRLAETGKFPVPVEISTLASYAEEILSLGNTTGEGWFLTAEMIELIKTGTPNIIMAQPFACLPNHVTGKGMVKPLRERFPQANIVPVDYDPGASEVNQLNRIKLMISTAISNQTETEANLLGQSSDTLEKEAVGVRQHS